MAQLQPSPYWKPTTVRPLACSYRQSRRSECLSRFPSVSPGRPIPQGPAVSGMRAIDWTADQGPLQRQPSWPLSSSQEYDPVKVPTEPPILGRGSSSFIVTSLLDFALTRSFVWSGIGSLLIFRSCCRREVSPYHVLPRERPTLSESPDPFIHYSEVSSL